MKKAEYHLLLTDKRIYMAKLLVDGGKIDLAKETALKGGNEYTLLTFKLKKTNKKPDTFFSNRFEKAAKKHQELLKAIIDKVGNSDKKTSETVLEFSQRNLDEIKKLNTSRNFRQKSKSRPKTASLFVSYNVAL